MSEPTVTQAQAMQAGLDSFDRRVAERLREARVRLRGDDLAAFLRETEAAADRARADLRRNLEDRLTEAFTQGRAASLSLPLVGSEDQEPAGDQTIDLAGLTVDEALDQIARLIDEMIEREFGLTEVRLRLHLAASGPEDQDALDRPADPDSPWRRATLEEVLQGERDRLQAWRDERLVAIRRLLQEPR